VHAGTVQFLAKFCVGKGGLGETVGKAKINLKVLDGDKDDIKILFFDDEESSYPWRQETETWNHMTCSDKVNKARGKEDVDGIERNEIQLTGHIRPRWWFLALADCSKAGTTKIEYELHLQNSLEGWEKEVSEDRRGLQYVFGPAFVAYVALAVAQLYANRRYFTDLSGGQAEALHPMVKILTAGILLAIGATVITMIHYYCLALLPMGTGTTILYLMGKLARVLSRFVLMSILMLVSKGRCVTYMMTDSDVRWVCKLLVPFSIISFLLGLWGEYADARKYATSIIYDTSYGYVVIIADLILFLVYLTNLYVVSSREYDKDHQIFYSRFGTSYSLFFLVVPVIAGLAWLNLIPAWKGELITAAGTNLATVACFGTLVMGLWPTRSFSYFTLDSRLPKAPPTWWDERQMIGLSTESLAGGSTRMTELAEQSGRGGGHNPLTL
jgi:hypothetical protein